MDWREARALFPSVDKTVYLNTAGGGPLSEPSAAAGRAYYEQSLADGDIHWDAWLERVESVRAKLAEFLNGAPANIAFTANASTGLNVAAHMLRGRGRVLAVADEFPSCTLPFLQLGYDVDCVETATDGTIGFDDLDAAVSGDTAVLAVSFVQYKSGFRSNLDRLGAFCRDRRLAFVVDATQGFGAFPIDVAACQADFVSFSAYKWANSGYSIGGVHLADRFLQPDTYPLVGWRSARDPYALGHDSLDLTRDARALEQGHPPFAGALSDRLGRKRVLVAAHLGIIVVVYPLFYITDHSVMLAALACQLLFALLMSGIQGAMPAAMVEMFPPKTRFSGVAIGYNVSLAVFGGTAPLVCTWLIAATGDIAAPAYYLILMAFVGLVAATRLKIPHGEELT